MKALTAALCLLLLSISTLSNARDFSLSEERVLGAYLAYYGRPPDSEGLAYWSDRLINEGGDINSVINAFGESDEYQLRFGVLNNTELVTNLYDQLFGRAPDQGGLDFYVGKLDSGEWSLQKISLVILDGISGADINIIDNRLEFSKHYVSEAEDGSAANLSAEELADFVGMIDSTSESLQSAYAALSDSSSVNIPPIANAGLDSTAFTLEAIYLDGSGSSDADGDELTYSWAFISAPSGTNALLYNITTSSPYITPDIAGTYTFDLQVNDGTNNSSTDRVVITVSSSNTGVAEVFYSGQIDGTFEGWDGDTIVKLTNGQYWIQTQYRYEYSYGYRPSVTVYKQGSSYTMLVDGTDSEVGVSQLSVIESKINGQSDGWDGSTVIELTNGQTWEQVEYYYTYRYAYRPDVLIYQSGSVYKMKIEGIDRSVTVVRTK